MYRSLFPRKERRERQLRNGEPTVAGHSWLLTALQGGSLPTRIPHPRKAAALTDRLLQSHTAEMQTGSLRVGNFNKVDFINISI